MKILKLSQYLLAALFYVANASAGSFFPSPLISAEWLAENQTEDIVILDVRKDLTSFIKEGHIEDAVLVNNKIVRVNKAVGDKELTRMRPTAQEFETFMQKHGVNKNSKVVITHQGKTPGHVAGGARLYWHLKTYNVENIALLNGGNAAWAEALEDLINESTNVIAGNYTVGDEDISTLASMNDVKKAINDKKSVLIDSRSLRYHIGLDKKNYVYDYGHIPNSKLLYYKLLTPLKGIAKFESNDKMNHILNALNIDTKLNKIIYCNSSYEASSVWFVLHELLGLKNTQIYDGSLHQWTQYPDNKMVTTLTP